MKHLSWGTFPRNTEKYEGMPGEPQFLLSGPKLPGCCHITTTQKACYWQTASLYCHGEEPAKRLIAHLERLVHSLFSTGLCPCPSMCPGSKWKYARLQDPSGITQKITGTNQVAKSTYRGLIFTSLFKVQKYQAKKVEVKWDLDTAPFTCSAPACPCTGMHGMSELTRRLCQDASWVDIDGAHAVNSPFSELQRLKWPEIKTQSASVLAFYASDETKPRKAFLFSPSPPPPWKSKRMFVFVPPLPIPFRPAWLSFSFVLIIKTKRSSFIPAQSKTCVWGDMKTVKWLPCFFPSFLHSRGRK